jgi:hypothetical protein
MRTRRSIAPSIPFPIRLFLPVLLLAAQACAYTTEFTGTTRLETPIKLERVYVYSFIDIRTEDLGPKMMDEMERQLALGLENRGVASEQHWFLDDPLGAAYARSQRAERVPVRIVIERNAEAERRFGAPYRLVVFPSEMQVDGPNYTYDIDWRLEDARTNQVVWSTTSRATHINIYSRDEDPVNRARGLVDRLIIQMDRSGVFGAAAAPAR